MFSKDITNKKVGLLGGSFNPAHEGHIHISLEAKNNLGLDYVIWLVSPQNPLKSSKDMESLDNRVKYAENITKNYDNIFISDIEKTFPTNFSYNTISTLKKEYSETRFCWLMGADNLENIHKWYRVDDLFKAVNIAIFGRKGFLNQEQKSQILKKYKEYNFTDKNCKNFLLSPPPCWKIINSKHVNISSTEIRQKQKI